MKKRLFASLSICLLLAGCDFAKSSFIATSEPTKPTTSTSDGNSDDYSSEIISSQDDSSSSTKTSKSSYNGLVQEIRFGEDVIELQIGKSTKAYYEIYPDIALNHNVRWASSDYSIATVADDGTVTALAEGEATISATAMDGSNTTASYILKVVPIKIKTIEINPTSLNLAVGETGEIKCFIKPSNATYVDLVFESEDDTIASVDDKGVVTALKKGETNITVHSLRNPEASNTCKVSVHEITVTAVKTVQNYIEMIPGQNYFFNVTVEPANASDKSVTYINENPDIVSVSETGEVVAIALGEATVRARSNANPSKEAVLEVVVKEKPAALKGKLKYNYKDYTNNNVTRLDCADYPVCNALIVPIWFTDSSNYINSSNKVNVRTDIQKAYLGTNQDTGWRSVKTFYEEESRGRFTFNGVVTDWFECGQSSSNFKSESSGTNNTINLVSTCISWYKQTYGISNMKGFDADGNGYVDAVIMIYGAPDYSSSNNYNAGNLWAYCYWVQGSSNVNDPKGNTFFWASYDFMYGSGHAHESRYFGGDTRYCNIDTHTFIHEFGHIMGLDDYYDYSGSYNPAAGFSMQDYNVGGHDPFSCLALGFVDPYVVTDSAEINIGLFQSTGDLIMVANKDNESPFDEYILVELYSPTGLNEFDSIHKYQSAYPQGPNKVGIRIWHVDARLLYVSSSSYGSNYNANQVTTNPLIPGNKVTLMMSNTYWSSSVSGYCSPLGRNYADYNLLQLIRNNTSTSSKTSSLLSASDLFMQGDSFTINKYNKQFVKQYYLDSGDTFPFTITVKSLTNTSAAISITKA